MSEESKLFVPCILLVLVDDKSLFPYIFCVVKLVIKQNVTFEVLTFLTKHSH